MRLVWLAAWALLALGCGGRAAFNGSPNPGVEPTDASTSASDADASAEDAFPTESSTDGGNVTNTDASCPPGDTVCPIGCFGQSEVLCVDASTCPPPPDCPR